MLATRTLTGKDISEDDETIAEDDGSDVEAESEKKPEAIPGATTFTMNPSDFPVLHQLFGEKKQLKEWDLHAILREVLNHFGKNHKVDWQHGNGKKARAVIIPQVRDKASFMREAWKERWVESILEHLTGGSEKLDMEDAAEWLLPILPAKKTITRSSLRQYRKAFLPATKSCNHLC